jgi:hypothetical protein
MIYGESPSLNEKLTLFASAVGRFETLASRTAKQSNHQREGEMDAGTCVKQELMLIEGLRALIWKLYSSTAQLHTRIFQSPLRFLENSFHSPQSSGDNLPK